ncbi:hypothetical protein [Motilimonas eburnea]|uniref:hypothetical protein n=1 Tax=Motilimonas eburnea TaxID=1737488 RepID=UPI001E62B5B7|nr:hypothetical protein [Motilimonas eburnea]MCE2571832.1 hypothetical protein [Motilimonas eburnea]
MKKYLKAPSIFIRRSGKLVYYSSIAFGGFLFYQLLSSAFTAAGLFFDPLTRFLLTIEIFVVWFGGICCVKAYWEKRKEMLKEIEKKQKLAIVNSAWVANINGTCPENEIVSAQHASGQMSWNKRADSLDWSLAADDPIVNWLPKKKDCLK